MPPVTTVDAAARTITTTRRALGLRHLAVAVVLLALYSVTLLVVLDHGGPGDCGPDGSSCADPVGR